MALILDGKETAAALAPKLRERLAALRAEGAEPGLAIVLAGDSRPSVMYASFMEKEAAAYGIPVRLVKKDETVTEEELIALMGELNGDPAVSGILMMMPSRSTSARKRSSRRWIPIKTSMG